MWNEFQRYLISLYQNIPTNVFLGLVSAFCLGTVLVLALCGYKKGYRYSSGLLLSEYVVLLLCSTVIYRKVVMGLGSKFQPFWSYRAISDGRKDLIVETLMNVVVFVPVGILLGCTFRGMTWWKVLLIGGGVSVGIEAMQYYYRRGFAETDDVMHNILGCIVGYVLYKLITQRMIPFVRTK